MKIGTISLLILIGSAPLYGQTGAGPFARIAVLRPHDGRTVEFEAGYMRHLAWHAQVKDPWVWFGWTVWAGERQRWFIYGTFGHSAASLDAPVAAAEDERDNVTNVVPHATFVGNAVYEFLPQASRGSGIPQPSARMELVTVELRPGTAARFEERLGKAQPGLREGTLWFRLVAGGEVPRYLRLRSGASLSAILDNRDAPTLAEQSGDLLARTTVEILTLRPALSHGLPLADR